MPDASPTTDPLASPAGDAADHPASLAGDAADLPATLDDRPELLRDRSFWGLLATQFLGAFNDNFYKQFVLLLAVDFKESKGLQSDPYQAIAQVAFAVPFVLFSLYTGAVADRYSKRTIVVLCKVLEIAVMAAATAVLWSFPVGSGTLLKAAILVIALMSLQSTLFGPAKYGILPELFRRGDLPRVNGAVQMTTFLAILLGTAIAGLVKDKLPVVWLAGAVAIGIAVFGTLTSLLVRKTPVAMPGVPFAWKSLLGDPVVWKAVFTNARLRKAVLVYALFFFLAATALPALNDFGKTQLGRDDTATSLLTMTLSLGMGIGCFVAGQMGRHRNRPDLIVAGSLGLLVTGGLIAAAARALPPGSVYGVELALILLFGGMAGLAVVPLQVVIQSEPPEEMKGRAIGVNNWCSWIGILLGAGFYYLLSAVFTGAAGQSQISDSFAVIGLLMLPAAIAYWRERAA